MKPPNAGVYGGTEETVEHLYSNRAAPPRKLVRELEKGGIKWQRQVERRWLADLLGDEKAVAPLLKFLKNTGTGGAREKELEWERISDQTGENLLG